MTITERLMAILRGDKRDLGRVRHETKGSRPEAVEIGDIRLESARLRSELGKLSARLGRKVFNAIMDKHRSSVSRETPGVGELLDEMAILRQRLAKMNEEHLGLAPNGAR